MATLGAFSAQFFTVHAGAEGWGVGRVFLIFGVEITYYGALWHHFQPCNLHTQYTQSMNDTHTFICYHLASKQPLSLPMDIVDLVVTRCPRTAPPQSLHDFLYLKLGFSYSLSSLTKRHPYTHFNLVMSLRLAVPMLCTEYRVLGTRLNIQILEYSQPH